MKSERRHELQQNDLAVYLNRINKSIEPYSRMIAVAVVAVVVGAIILAVYNNNQTWRRSEATLNLIQATAAQDAEELLEVSENFPDTIAGHWARLYQGQQYLSQGIRSLYEDRSNAEELLTDAQTVFKDAIQRSNDPLLRSRAHFGIARAAESLGNLDEAIDAYNEVIAVNESEAMVKKAKDRIESLNDPETQDFLAWFSEQDFAPPEPSLPPSLPGSDTLPDLPDLDLPDLGLDSGDDTEPRTLEGGLELPSDPGDGDAPASESESSESDTGSEDAAPTLELPGEQPAGDAPATPADAAEAAEETAEAAADGSDS